MKKGNVMSAVLGLLAGLVIGFTVANRINKSAFEKQPATSASANTPNSNPALPKDHPPIGTAAGEQPPNAQGAPRPEVAVAIEKAKAEPQNYEAQMTAGDLYYQIKRFDEAAKFYEIAAKLKPSAAEPMVKAGNAYFDSEKYEQAEKWYTQALQKEPKNINVRTDLGLTFFLRSPRDVERAIKEYKTSLGIDPNHEVTLQNLALAYGENGDKAALQTTLDELKKVNPDNPVIRRSETK